MTVTYEAIATQTLGSAAANITFSSIPSTYTDLVVIMSNITTSSSGQNIRLRFNGDTSTNYSQTNLNGYSSSVASNRSSNSAYINIGYNTVGSSTTEPAMIINHVQNYANTSVNKTIISNQTQAGTELQLMIGLWRSTSAINQILLYPTSGNLNSGTTATIYGIKAE